MLPILMRLFNRIAAQSDKSTRQLKRERMIRETEDYLSRRLSYRQVPWPSRHPGQNEIRKSNRSDHAPRAEKTSTHDRSRPPNSCDA